MRKPLFHVIVPAGVLTWLFAAAGPAAAAEWCSVHLKADSIIDCGYSSYAECHEKSGGRNAVCIPDPDRTELNARQKRRVG